jgi:hypothetical protein
MRRTTVLWIVPLVALTLGVTGCDEGTSPEETETSLTVLLTDAPGDVLEVWVRIVEMYLQEEEGREDLTPTDAPVWVELVALENDYLQLAEGTLPEGAYQLRLVIDAAVLVEEGPPVLPEESPTEHLFVLGDVMEADWTEIGRAMPEDPVGELQCPSCTQSGIKIVPIEEEIMVEGEEQTLVMDFAVDESFGKEAGGSGQWVMRPVIRQVVTPAEVTQGG